MLPSPTCEAGGRAGHFPSITVQDLAEMLTTDVFGVGITPSACKLRGLSVLAAYDMQCADDPRGAPPFHELKALTTIVPGQRTTGNFGLRVMSVALQDVHPRRPEQRSAADLLKLTGRVCAELGRRGIKVVPSYFEYDLRGQLYGATWYEAAWFQSEYVMYKAVGAEELPVPKDWDCGKDPEPEFIRWDEVFCPGTDTMIERPCP